MFKSSGDGIYVPLGQVTWRTSFSATYPNVQFDTDLVTGPTDPDSSDDFPAWTDVFSNPN
jgi:hypothetical protein